MKILKKIFLVIISILLVSVLVYNIYNFICIKVLKKDMTEVFNYAILEVVSGSMEPTIHIGDLIVIDTKDKYYNVDDIITFKDKEDSLVTHRIITIKDGIITTKGDNNNAIDDEPITEDRVVGKYVTKINNGGRVIASFKSPLTLIMIFIIGFTICVYKSLDKKGEVILTPEEKEYEEFLRYKKHKKNKQKEQEKQNKKAGE